MIREIVFGMEDGMVSTLGAITGIAVGIQNHFTVLLAGLVIVSVESLSMAVGSYLSSKSEKDVDARKLHEEREEIENNHHFEKQELEGMFLRDGWPKKIAKEMSLTASQDKKLMLHEMSYRELGVIPHEDSNPLKNGIAMYFSYIAGGLVPLCPYFFLSVASSIRVSIVITLAGLFILGALTTKFTHRLWWKAGSEVLILGGLAVVIGVVIGTFGERILGTALL